MQTEIWGIASCEACRKARKALPEAVFRDIRLQLLDAAERKAILQAFGDRAINRASTTWRGLDPSERELDGDTLLERYPTLMKRPVIRLGGTLHPGLAAALRAKPGLDGTP